MVDWVPLGGWADSECLPGGGWGPGWCEGRGVILGFLAGFVGCVLGIARSVGGMCSDSLRMYVLLGCVSWWLQACSTLALF